MRPEAGWTEAGWTALAERARGLLSPVIALLASGLALCCLITLPDVAIGWSALSTADARLPGWAGAAVIVAVATAAAVSSDLCPPRVRAAARPRDGGRPARVGLGRGCRLRPPGGPRTPAARTRHRGFVRVRSLPARRAVTPPGRTRAGRLAAAVGGWVGSGRRGSPRMVGPPTRRGSVCIRLRWRSSLPPPYCCSGPWSRWRSSRDGLQPRTERVGRTRGPPWPCWSWRRDAW